MRVRLTALIVATCVAVVSSLAVAEPARAGTWSSWMDRGGILLSGPAVTSWAPDRLDVFARGPNNRLVHRWFSAGRWKPWEDLGNLPGIGTPTAVSWGSGRIDLFVADSDNHLNHKSYSDGSWKPWQDLGGALILPPTVSSWAPGRLDVFALDTNDRLAHLWFSDGSWKPWQDLGAMGDFGAPEAVSWGPGRIDLFAVSATGHVWQRTYDNGWSTWGDRGGNVDVGTGVASWAPGRLDVFGKHRLTDRLVHTWYSNGTWKSWQDLDNGTELASVPAAISRNENQIDVFGVDIDSKLIQKSWF